MKVVAIRVFKDLQARKMRYRGEEFELSPERFEAINATRHGVLVEEVEPASVVPPLPAGGDVSGDPGQPAEDAPPATDADAATDEQEQPAEEAPPAEGKKKKAAKGKG